MSRLLSCAAIVSAALATASATPAFAAGELTAQQIFDRSKKAYDRVRTLDETVQATMSGKPGGTAHILFERPGKLRVSGATMFNSSEYDLLSNKSTWVSMNGAWESQQNAEMGIAAITGISGTSGTIVPALLLHTRWGSPFPPADGGAIPVASETVNGRATYRISVNKPIERVYWIDRKTFFLVKMKQKLGTYISVLTFSKPHINMTIPARAFVK